MEKYLQFYIYIPLLGYVLSLLINNLVKFWMGQSGFKKFLKNLKNGEA